jgi:hypothetical protein
MKKTIKVNGYKLVEDGSKYYIDNFPSFPNQEVNSKVMFQSLERDILNEKTIHFPIKLIKSERVLKLSKETEKYFSVSGIINFIQKEKRLFINTKTFFKLKISFNNNDLELKVIYYTIHNEKGLTSCNSLKDLLDLIFINYEVNQFTKNRVGVLKNNKNIDIDLIRQIPLFPVQWLNYDENGNLLDFPNIGLVKDWDK